MAGRGSGFDDPPPVAWRTDRPAGRHACVPSPAAPARGGIADDFCWHSGELGYVDPVAAAGGAGLHFMQEDDTIAVLDDRDVLVDAGVEVVGELSELK